MRATQPYKIFMSAPIFPILIVIVVLHYTYTIINRVLGLKHIPVTLMPSNNLFGDP